MVQTGGLIALINSKPGSTKMLVPETNIYSICSKFPGPDSSIEIFFDGEIRVYLMDG